MVDLLTNQFLKLSLFSLSIADSYHNNWSNTLETISLIERLFLMFALIADLKKYLKCCWSCRNLSFGIEKRNSPYL